MLSARSSLGLALALCAPTASLFAQIPGAFRDAATDSRILLGYASFDPLQGLPEVPAALRATSDTNLWIVQFPGAPTDHDRSVVETLGGRLHGYLPNDAYVVRMGAGTAAAVAVLPEVRWVGSYEPAYRLQPEIRNALLADPQLPEGRYNMVMADKRRDKKALEAKIVAIGGKVFDRHEGSLLFTAELDGPELLAAARLDEVLWIDRWTPEEEDMDNARIQDGANAIETAGGYTGAGVRGHVYEGVEYNHPDFTTPMTNVRSGGQAQSHGHCTAGCVFGNGTSAPQARGMAPDAVGFYTNYSTVTAGWSRNQVIGDVVNVHNCMFTTASWGNTQTQLYTSVSADADDIVFDYRIPWTQSMSNLGTNNARPQAWGKNIISIGGIYHYDNSIVADDSWSGGGSTGPAHDGRIKPDLCNFYDQVWTSDRSGAAGYSPGNSFTGFNGTSAATPITAGTNALAIQMYTDHIFSNTPRVANGSRFQNRPYAQTLKALQIACAYTYPQAQGTRLQVGWGHPRLDNMYNRRNRMAIVAEDRPISQGNTHSYLVNVLNGETTLRVCMTYLDPAGNPAAAIDRVNDLTLRVIHPNGTTAYWGNVGLLTANTSSTGGAADTIDTVECVFLNNPTPGNWTIEVTAPTVAQDANTATPGIDATYALVANGAIMLDGSGCGRHIPDASTTGAGNVIPFGCTEASSLPTIFATDNGGAVGGAVYFDLQFNQDTHWSGVDVNTDVAVGTDLIVDVYLRTGTHVGFEGSTAGWTARTTGHGVAAGVDQPSRIFFNEPLFLSGVPLGICLVARNFNHRYTNGTGTNQSYNDAHVSLSLGTASNVPFTTPTISPRVANVAVYYRTDTESWTNQLYQTILRREQLGSAGTIHDLAFSCNATARHFNRELRIRMSHVPAGHTMSTTFANNLPSPVTVLQRTDYTWHVAEDDWSEIGLATPFAYDGNSDVVVEIFTRGNSSTGFPNGGNRVDFNTGDTQMNRLFAYGFVWNGAPATGTLGTSGLRLRANFNCATFNEYGTSCGPLRTAYYSTPNRGSTAWYDLQNAPPNSGVILGMGYTPTAAGVSLNPYGFTNCFAWHDLPITLFKVTDAAGATYHGFSVPNNPVFDGLKVHGQWFAFDATQPGGITVSNYITNTIGIDP
ncbi:MAG: S8 family serine peptidase [Planctomycetes bacterium]|nr:S8 family serine peptidase [Planctomycetota bacterium]MCB9887839.1 S8 family serine peptidase [Planctomycetota bacterium]